LILSNALISNCWLYLCILADFCCSIIVSVQHEEIWRETYVWQWCFCQLNSEMLFCQCIRRWLCTRYIEWTPHRCHTVCSVGLLDTKYYIIKTICKINCKTDHHLMLQCHHMLTGAEWFYLTICVKADVKNTICHFHNNCHMS
jgi:hypothetical protein